MPAFKDTDGNPDSYLKLKTNFDAARTQAKRNEDNQLLRKLRAFEAAMYLSKIPVLNQLINDKRLNISFIQGEDIELTEWPSTRLHSFLYFHVEQRRMRSREEVNQLITDVEVQAAHDTGFDAVSFFNKPPTDRTYDKDALRFCDRMADLWR